MNNKSKEIQQEISNVIELFLDLDKNINKIKEKENQLKLSDNSKDIIQELLQSEKITKFFLHDEKIKKHRDSITIVDSVLNNNTNINDNKSRHKNIHILKKINPISFNQSCLLSNPFYYGTEAELYYIKRYIKSKILEIVKSCFESKFNENKKEIFDKKNKTNLNPIDKKQKFILISSYNLKKVKLRNLYYNSIIKNKDYKAHYPISMKNYFIRTDDSKSLYRKIINNNSNISIIDNSNIINKNKPNNNSCINIKNQIFNKNNSLTSDKCTSANLKYNKDNKNIYKKRNIILLNKKSYYDFEKSFMPLLNINDFKYKKELRFKPKKIIPRFDSGIMELIHFNTKNNIKAKAEKEFLNECLKETYRSLRKINPLNNSKCFVDYSRSTKNNKDNNEIYGKKIYELPLNQKKFFNGFEYKNIFKYSFKEKLTKQK